MANHLKNRRSRRRLAAVTFLSNISLDGSHQDSRLNLLYKKEIGFLNKTDECHLEESDEPDDCFSDSENSKCKANKCILQRQKSKRSNLDVYSQSSDSECIFTPVKCYTDDISTKKFYTSGNERTTPILGEGDRKCKRTLHKSLGGQISAGSDSDRYTYGSSNESISGLGARPKTGIAPIPIPETKALETKFIKSPNEYHFQGERMVLVSNLQMPFFVCSIIPYIRNQRSRPEIRRDVVRKRNTSGPRPLSSLADNVDPFDLLGVERGQDGQEFSYGKFLFASKEVYDKPTTSSEDYTDSSIFKSKTNGKPHQVLVRCFSYDQGMQRTNPHVIATSPSLDANEENVVSNAFVYHANLLDDPELIAGKHRTLLTFTSYTTSVIDYVRPSDLKKEINDKFKEKFPHIQLTLSKLRSLKREMRKIVKLENNIDMVAVAQAYVYFEKLILKGLINKPNRKLCAAACLLLSCKLNDVKGESLRNLIIRTENLFRLNRRELIAAEFAVLVALEFGLHVPNWEIFPHYQRLLYEY